MATDPLQEERDFLLRSLDDLEREHGAGEIDEGDYVALRRSYTVRAAQVLRALERRDGGPPASSPPALSPARRARRFRRTALGVVGVLSFAVLAGALVASSSGERINGQQVSGSAGRGSSERLARARQLMGEGKALAAIKLYDAVLSDDPSNAEALAYRGWLLKLAGLPDQAMASLDRAVAADPSYPDARFFRGMVLYQDRRDPAAAVPELRAFLAANPKGDLVPMVEGVLERAMRESGQTPPPPEGGDQAR